MGAVVICVVPDNLVLVVDTSGFCEAGSEWIVQRFVTAMAVNKPMVGGAVVVFPNNFVFLVYVECPRTSMCKRIVELRASKTPPAIFFSPKIGAIKSNLMTL